LFQIDYVAKTVAIAYTYSTNRSHCNSSHYCSKSF